MATTDPRRHSRPAERDGAAPSLWVLPVPDEVISVSRLTKRYGGEVAIVDVSFAVKRGTVVGLLGPNGSGKTTTLRVLLGQTEADSGTALFGPTRYCDLPDRHRVGTLLEDRHGHRSRSARAELQIVAAAVGAPSQRVEEVLALAGLSAAADGKASTFGHGMRQRLGLAAAMVGRPEVLVLDEPSTGLDPEGLGWLHTTLRDFARAGNTVLVSSRVLADVAPTVDEVVVLNAGRVLAQASIAELRAGVARTASMRVRTPHAGMLADALAAHGHAPVHLAPDLVRVHDITAEELGWLVADAGVVVYEMVAEAADLETALGLR
jgi:ABC-2 type transport system ATP-binding protein